MKNINKKTRKNVYLNCIAKINFLEQGQRVCWREKKWTYEHIVCIFVFEVLQKRKLSIITTQLSGANGKIITSHECRILRVSISIVVLVKLKMTV